MTRGDAVTCPSATVAVLGSTGFVGGHVVQALRRSGQTVRELGRSGPGRHVVPVDVSSVADMTAALLGCDAAIWCVSYLGPDEAVQRAVNTRATADFARAASAAGVRRVIAIGTASVFGSGPHRGRSPESLTPDPQSPRSRSRWEGEVHVVAAGGIVLRPALTYGRGDRWFLPALARLSADSFSAEELQARISVVSAPVLGLLATRLATTPRQPARSSYVLAERHPIRLADAFGAIESLRARSPRDDGPIPELTRHQRRLLATDNWYDVDALWEEVGDVPPRPGLHLSGPERDWYASVMTSSARGA
ncbi:NAD-dependent epimerase/dehydratase family protein [Frigoribacterium sp. 2-23]|uniref:NAD-dependent epimerase/dehydratase family protein n=1 Tax=Frigoribacterium sp. 2-23 TaxID=3415006 RepID=UPI003C6FB014